MPRAAILLGLALAFASFASSADAQQSDKRRPQDKPAQTPQRFSEAERDIIAAYFTQHAQEAKPLPRGIAKNLARGKPLPPGIASQRLPEKLVAELPSRAGAEITIFGNRIVLLEASGLVVDIIEGIFK